MRTFRLLIALGPIFALGCTAAPLEGVEHSEADLSARQIDEACSPPVRSDDGAFVALDLCPKDGAPGRIVRLSVANGEQKEVATYPAADRVESLAATGSRFYFAVRHEVNALGQATKGLDVSVHDWSLATHRTIRPAPAEGAGEQRQLETLMLSADEARVAFLVGAATQTEARQLFVADVASEAAPAALDLGAAPEGVRISTAGNAFAAHVADAELGTGETVILVETGADGAPSVTGTRHVDWTSAAFGQGGTRVQEPFDGTRVLGWKPAAEGMSLGTVDPKTGAETVLETAPRVTLVTDLGADVLYSRITQVDGAFVRTLVKQPRAGGDKIALIVTTAPAEADLRFGFEAIALTKTGTHGIFATRTGVAPIERYIVSLDGSTPAQLLGPKTTLVDQVGDQVLLLETSVAPKLAILDLATGGTTELGPSGGIATRPTLLGNGTAIERKSCTTAEGARGVAITQVGGTSDPLACAWMPWTSVGLAAPGSDAIVFYNSAGTFPSYRYTVGIVRP